MHSVVYTCAMYRFLGELAYELMEIFLLKCMNCMTFLFDISNIDDVDVSYVCL